MRGISTIIFDLDGTLVDTLPDIAEAMNRVLAGHGHAIHSPERYRALIGGGIGAMVARLIPEFDRARQAKVHDEFIARYGAHLCEKTACYPGMVDLVDDLSTAGYTLAVFSNKRHELTERIVRHFFRPDRFKTVRGHVDSVGRKPDPVATRGLLMDLGAEPGNAVLIGDTAIDAETARAVDMEFLGVGWGYREAETLVDAGAAAVFDHARQIPEWIERQNHRDRLRAGTVA